MFAVVSLGLSQCWLVVVVNKAKTTSDLRRRGGKFLII